MHYNQGIVLGSRLVETRVIKTVLSFKLPFRSQLINLLKSLKTHLKE